MYLRTIIVIAAILIANTARAQQPKDLSATVKEQLIDSLTSSLKRNYVYPEKATLMVEAIRQKHQKQGYSAIKDARQFANELTKDIRSVHKDNHLAVRYDPGLEKQILAFEATLQKENQDFEKERTQNFFFRKAEILPGNIGYIVFTNFADTNELSRKTVRAAFQFVANSNALILDLRNNFGGRPAMASEIAAYFFEKQVVAGRSFNKMENKWTDQLLGGRPAITKGLALTMPLYILTSERTFSAAEGLAYNLKYLKNAVTVGDTTRGGAHTTRSFALGNGFVGFIPFTRSEHIVTKTDWEGTGVTPSVRVHEDSSLLKAQQLILIEQLNNERDTTGKRRLQWLLNDLHTKMQKVVVPADQLAKYTGAFEEFLVTLEDGKLFCTNTHQRNKKDELIAITNTLFKIDEQSQIEFITDRNRIVTVAKLYWFDGWVDTLRK